MTPLSPHLSLFLPLSLHRKMLNKILIAPFQIMGTKENVIGIKMRFCLMKTHVVNVDMAQFLMEHLVLMNHDVPVKKMASSDCLMKSGRILMMNAKSKVSIALIAAVALQF